MSVKTKTILFILSLLFSSLFIILIVFAFVFWKNDSVEINQSAIDTPYYNTFSLGVVCEDHIVYYCFNSNEQNIDIICIQNESFDNINTFKDNFFYSTKNILGFSINRAGNFSNAAISDAINLIGGIAIIDKEGKEKFLLGDEFVNIIKNEKDALFIAYLFGVFLQQIFYNEQYSFLYNNSNISIIDIENNKNSFKMCLQQINCINVDPRS